MKRDSKGRFIKEKSLAGTLVIVLLDGWNKKEFYWQYENGKIITSNKKGVYVSGIVAGDNYNRGISIVEINSGEEIICLTPNMKNYQDTYTFIKTGINKGRISLEELNLIWDGIYDPEESGNMASCPYK